MELNFRHNVNVAVRIAVEMGLFGALPLSGEPLVVAELAKKTNAEEEFVLRISRVLGAFDILQESDSSSGLLAYSHTPLSRFLTTPPAQASTRHQFDNMLQGHALSAGKYYLKHGFKNPEDAKNSPFTFAHSTHDASVFDILETMPERMAIFNSAMTITAVFGLNEVVTSYPFDHLEANAEGLVLVDVGGGKGHVVNEIRSVYPHMKGRIVLEDMKVVLEGGTVVPEGEVALQPYDFFKEQQPIKGANYFFKSIFHDWPDSYCLQILSNLAPAMRGYSHSRLLICDLVLPDRNPDMRKVLRDIHMLLIAGKERNIEQWHRLLGQGGFRILKIHGINNANSSIIEAVLDDE